MFRSAGTNPKKNSKKQSGNYQSFINDADDFDALVKESNKQINDSFKAYSEKKTVFNSHDSINDSCNNSEISNDFIVDRCAIKDDIVKENFSSEIIQNLYTSFNKEITENNDIIPNVTGMPAMDAISLLENFGLIVEVKGIGKVKKQSLKKGTPIKKGATIILNLS